MALGTLASLALAAPLAGVAQSNAAALAAPCGSASTCSSTIPLGPPSRRTAPAWGCNGAVGSHVKMNGSYVAFDRHPPDEGISYGLAHLIKVNDAADGSLDPGNWELHGRDPLPHDRELRQRPPEGSGHHHRWPGEAAAAEGCHRLPVQVTYRPSSSDLQHALNDGQWHVVRCVRTPADSMYVDGVLRTRIRKLHRHHQQHQAVDDRREAELLHDQRCGQLRLLRG